MIGLLFWRHSIVSGSRLGDQFREFWPVFHGHVTFFYLIREVANETNGGLVPVF